MSRELVEISMVGSDWVVKTYLNGDGTYAFELHSSDFTSIGDARQAIADLNASVRQHANG